MIYFEEGNPDMRIDRQRVSQLLDNMLVKMGRMTRVLILPPDITRFYSYAGEITCMLYDKLKSKCHIEIMPATGTHFPLTPEELYLMYPGIPHEIFKDHDWKKDVVRLGTIPSEKVYEMTGGLVDFPIHCELNKTIVEGRWDQIISVGQLVPHELVGIANYNKNLFIGVGGKDIIDKTHFIGAMYGLENLMGHIGSPVRKVLDYKSGHFTSHLPVSYILTIRGMDKDGQLITRGVYAGNAAMALVFTSNYLVNVLYSLYLLLNNKTYRNFSLKGTNVYWIMALFMGALWAGGIVIYGIGSTMIGNLGAYLGFPVLMIVGIIAGNIFGILTGEWAGVGTRPKRIMAAGITVLTVAIIILGLSMNLI